MMGLKNTGNVKRETNLLLKSFKPDVQLKNEVSASHTTQAFNVKHVD